MNFDKTGKITANEDRDTGVRSFDVGYALVSDGWISEGTAWQIASNAIGYHDKYQGAPLRRITLDGTPETWGQRFEVTAHYEDDGEADPVFATLSFSTRGGREKKTHSLATVGYSATQYPAPNFLHGIGFNNGIFQGVDCVVPQFGFSINVKMRAAYFSSSQIAFFHELTGKTNALPFWICRPGDCLFNGMTGNTSWEKRKKEWVPYLTCSFEFEAMPSLVNATIPPFTGINKRGMDYFWVFHADKKDETSGITVPVPLAAYVEQVYESGDFSWFNTLRGWNPFLPI